MKNFIVHILACLIPISNYRKKFRNWCFKDEILKDNLLCELSNLKTQNICIQNANQDLYTRVEQLQNANQDLHTRVEQLQNDNQDLHIQQRHLSYRNKVEQLKNKIKNKSTIRVCFSVVYDSVFPANNLYEKMIESDIFEPFILVIPDTLRGEENMFCQMDKTYKSLSSKYDNIFNSYDYENNTFIDYSDKIDILCPANPYDAMTYDLYSISYASSKNILIFNINYSYLGRTKYENNLINLDSTKFYWKIFAENTFSKEMYCKKLKYNKNNICVSGYTKMDSLALISSENRIRKKIIIAPHHTIINWENGLNIGTFLNYADFYLELPNLYPEIDFVYRPHPILEINLKKDEIWGIEKTNDYISKMKSYKNLEYQEGGDYFDTFVNSDGLIHDCGSFLAEYFYTDHPQCYIAKDKETIEKEYLDFGKEMLENTYLALDKETIINFINDVIINNNDYMKESRLKFANEKIKINYPNSTQYILENIKEEFKYD